MPAVTARQIEDRIIEAVDRAGPHGLRRALAARGLWDWMSHRIKTSSHAGHLRIGGLLGTLEQTAIALRAPSDRVSRLFSRVCKVEVELVKGKVVPLAEVAGDVVFSRPLQKLAECRAKERGKVKQSRLRRGERYPLKGGMLPPQGGNAGGNGSPLMVSPPVPPLPLSPSPHIPGVEGSTAPVPDELRQATLQAFDLWSRASRNRPVVPEQNEHRPLLDLLEVVMQDPPIARGREVIPRQNLVPQAVEFCRLDRREFKGPKYAAAIVRNLLDEWALKGVPGSDGRGPGRLGSRVPDRNGAAVATLDRPKMRRF
jgi:hypothetical protein